MMSANVRLRPLRGAAPGRGYDASEDRQLCFPGAMLGHAARLLLTAAMCACALPAQNPVYLVLLKGASALAYYTPEGRMLTSVPVGQHPHEMAFSPDRRFLYTTDNGTMRIEQPGTGGNTVSVIDLAARRKTATIALGNYRRPHGIDVDPRSGRLLVTTELPDQLLLVDPVQRKVMRTYETKGKTSHMVTLGPGAKFAYVSNSSSASVSAINLDNGAVKVIPTGTRPEGSVLSKDGRELYVCNREGEGISVIDTAKNQAIAHIPTGKGPVRIALSPDGGQLVYALMHEKKVAFADPRARKQTNYVLLTGEPVSLHVSQDGQFAFASAEQSDRVYVVSIARKRMVRDFGTAKGSGPDPVIDYALTGDSRRNDSGGPADGSRALPSGKKPAARPK